MEANETITKYRQRVVLYSSLMDEATHIINSKLKKLNIKINKIESRIKNEESFINKIERKEVSDPFSEIKDILGVRIVCLFLSDIQAINQIVKDAFEIIEEDNKIDNSELNTFGYMSVHFVVKLRDEYNGPRYDNIKHLLFEIQVRTMTMDAWANISHYLDYKTEKDIPKDLKKDFFALSGLFFVADKHFELFFDSRQKVKDQLVEHFERSEIQGEELNIDSLTAYLKVNIPDRKSPDKNISELVNELHKFGYSTINDIDALVKNVWDSFLQYEKERPPQGRKFTDVGVIRIILKIANEEYYEYIHKEGSKGIMDKYRKMSK